MRDPNPYITVTLRNLGRIPQSIAMCDVTGIPVMHKDLRKEMIVIGDGTEVWSGKMVHKKFLDKSNPQRCIPPLGPEGLPVENPRPVPWLSPTP